MGWALLGISIIFGLIAFVCFVMVVVKMFQNKQTGLGIGSIIGAFCGIGYIIALVVGWMNKNAWGLQKVMPIFTVSLILSFVLYGASVVILGPQLVELQRELESQKANMPNNMGGIDSPIETAPQP